jgi:hypothetical protein
MVFLKKKWLGYKPFQCQVQIHDEARGHQPATIAKFAHQIGQSVDAFVKVGAVVIRLVGNQCTKTRFSPTRLTNEISDVSTRDAINGGSDKVGSSATTL